MPRGFTLIEMLVVVLLIVLISAIVGPLAVSEIGRTSLREAERQVEAAAMLARADAQRRGAVVQLLARPEDEARGIGVEIVSIDLTSQDGSASEAAEDGLDDGLGAGAGVGVPPGTPAASGAGARPEKVVLTLPVGVRLRSSPPATGGPNAEDLLDAPPGTELRGESSGTARDGEDGPGGLLSLCVFFPDGQIFASTPRYLVSRTGRAVSIQINRWTGKVTSTEVEPAPETGEPAGGAGGDAASSASGAGGAP